MKASPTVITTYHVSWFIIAALLLLNLVTGAVINNYQVAIEEREKAKKEAKAKAKAKLKEEKKKAMENKQQEQSWWYYLGSENTSEVFYGLFIISENSRLWKMVGDE